MRARLALAVPALVAALACGGSTAPRLADGAPTGTAGDAQPTPGTAAPAAALLAPTPPMGWNDWAHYQCNIDEDAMLANARALVASGLAAKGYDTVTVDDCWMQAARGPSGELLADAARFPHGMKWLGDQLHAMGLKFGIYEVAGPKTCEGRAGSGQPEGGGRDHYAEDAQLFASWGVDYLKLDGCYLWIPPGQTMEQAFRAAYAAQSAALAATGRPIVFSESAPAYFDASDRWMSVLGWAGDYGQLWRIGADIQIWAPWDPAADRWPSVMKNYRYTRGVGQFTRPGGWNDPDFIIGGDPGLTLDEAKSQLSLWAMMSAPLILSSDLTQVTRSPDLVAALGNAALIAIDQDPLGEPAAVVQDGATVDVLVKRLANGDRAVAVLNHGDAPATYAVGVDGLGFPSCASCGHRVEDLWSGAATDRMAGTLPRHATALFRVARVP